MVITSQKGNMLKKLFSYRGSEKTQDVTKKEDYLLKIEVKENEVKEEKEIKNLSLDDYGNHLN